MALSWERLGAWGDNWRDAAACRGHTPELFFPVGATGLAIEQIDAAKAVCSRCPVAGACLEFALATNQEAGVWGGTTEDERRRLLRTRREERRASLV